MKKCTMEPACNKEKICCCCECDEDTRLECICTNVEEGANGTCEFLKEGRNEIKVESDIK